MSDNHKAVISRIHTRPFPNSDNLVLGLCHGFQVIVGKEVCDGELGIFFMESLQLSQEYANANDLVRRKLPDGTYNKGYFSENRRCRTIKLRGECSYGYWAPLTSLAFTNADLSLLRKGDLLDELNGVKLCQKYFTPATQLARDSKLRSVKRGETSYMKKHIDTKQYKRAYESIPIGATIILTEKIHATSHRVAHSKELRQLRWYEKLAKIVGLKIDEYEWKYVTGSRNVIISDNSGFYSEDFRRKASEFFEGKLPKGFAVFLEATGFDGEKPIMNRVSTKCLNDKEFTKRYGEEITYSYGTKPYEVDVWVYRITFTTESGNVVEIPWNLVKEYCKSWNVKHVPEVCEPFILKEGELYDCITGYNDLTKYIESFTDGPSTICPEHPREGVCLKYEFGLKWDILKNKSFNFLQLEHQSKDEDVVDLEEIS